MADSFHAIQVVKDDSGVRTGPVDLTTDDFPDLPEGLGGDVGIDVEYSTVNYKDGLALSGNPGVVRVSPLVPGIDYVGTVTASESGDFSPGDKVILNGWSVGEMYWGGFAEKARAKADWLVPLPDRMDSVHAMVLGTAGYTAMLCVMALEEAGLEPSHGAVLVTGAAGGVGSVAVALLAGLGYEVIAATGRPETHKYLASLGAASFVDRAELAKEPRALDKARWAGAVDAVGGVTLAHVLSSTMEHGAVAACGMAGGVDLPASVMPFIIRGVSLLGVNSATCPKARRLMAWSRLASEMTAAQLDTIKSDTVPLDGVVQVGKDILHGRVRGRVVVDVNA